MPFASQGRQKIMFHVRCNLQSEAQWNYSKVLEALPF